MTTLPITTIRQDCATLKDGLHTFMVMNPLLADDDYLEAQKPTSDCDFVLAYLGSYRIRDRNSTYMQNKFMLNSESHAPGRRLVALLFQNQVVLGVPTADSEDIVISVLSIKDALAIPLLGVAFFHEKDNLLTGNDEVDYVSMVRGAIVGVQEIGVDYELSEEVKQLNLIEIKWLKSIASLQTFQKRNLI